MKKEIIAYITALVNSKDLIVKRSLKIGINPNDFKIIFIQNFKEELISLLDFIEDIPEVKEEPIVVVSCYSEEAALGRRRIEELEEENKGFAEVIKILDNGNNMKIKRIKELEESCENFAETEKNLHKKIEKLESDKLALDIILNENKSKKEKISENNWSK